ncbi:XdhC/CoxI family protein [Mycolicibacterium sp. 050158]|uniref:XdhC family protein n=1 Tax=Mycolicibacterium sp. 050158 TaxID=3090602 RepID=UPI00299EBABA|nr:XdhC/CoxI family protein [Mycolicibacterium sp. 050158]MDX1887981.1 XdhC/CoxI family protein [Mycolicibacterium sp. 050158]
MTFLAEFADQVGDWYRGGHRFALCRVVASRGSSPLPIGATMVVGPKGEALGSVSGGCVEGAVYQAAMEILQGAPPRLEQYGYSDADALAAGLTCGGTVTVFVEAVDEQSFPGFGRILAAVGQSTTAAWATDVARLADSPSYRMTRFDSGEGVGSLGEPALDSRVADLLTSAVQTSQGSGLHRMAREGGDTLPAEVCVFVHVLYPPPRLIIVGASSHATALAAVGKAVGFHTTVCDARPVFATPDRFPGADEVVRQWPGEYLAQTHIDGRTAVCVLTHDTRFDVPAVLAALRSSAAYIGVMGSRKTHHDRLRRLRDAGATPAQLARLHSPIGLDLGGRSAGETALSILAEIVAVRHARSGRPLATIEGPLH